MADPWWKEFGNAFWITLAGILTGCVGMAVKAGLKSKCSRIKIGCFECVRDTRAEAEIEEFNVEHGVREEGSPR